MGFTSTKIGSFNIQQHSEFISEMNGNNALWDKIKREIENRANFDGEHGDICIEDSGEILGNIDIDYSDIDIDEITNEIYNEYRRLAE